MGVIVDLLKKPSGTSGSQSMMAANKPATTLSVNPAVSAPVVLTSSPANATYSLPRASTGRSGAVATAAPASSAVSTGLDSTGQIDWSQRITSGIESGVDAATMKAYLAGRDAKIAAAGGTLDQYKDDAVSQAAQAYIAGLAQQTPEYPVQYDSYSDLYGRGGYSEAAAQQQKLVAAQLAQLENYYGGQQGDITSSAEEQARQAYIAYMQSLNAMPQALAASGFSGGLADSQRLALDLGYQNNQREILQSRDSALNDLTTALNDARLQTSEPHV